MLSPSPLLAADLVVRGSFPVNVVHLVTAKKSQAELKDYAGDVTAAVTKCDTLARINYVAFVAPRMADTFLYIFLYKNFEWFLIPLPFPEGVSL